MEYVYEAKQTTMIAVQPYDPKTSGANPTTPHLEENSRRPRINQCMATLLFVATFLFNVIYFIVST